MTETLKAEEKKRVFHTLDALRGVAAMELIPHHTDRLFGNFDLPESFLAVDLFFVMSGVVIANAYEHRLHSGLSGGRFLTIRLIRLYPLYLIGIGLGLLRLIGNTLQSHRFDIGTTVSAALLALFMIPAMGLPSLDGPRWSLFFEMAANAVYGWTIKILTNLVLWLVVSVCGLGLVHAEFAQHTLDTGYSLPTLYAGFCRVGFSFSLGILIWRLSSTRSRQSSMLAWLVVLAVGAGLAVTPPQHPPLLRTFNGAVGFSDFG